MSAKESVVIPTFWSLAERGLLHQPHRLADARHSGLHRGHHDARGLLAARELRLAFPLFPLQALPAAEDSDEPLGEAVE